MNSFMCQTENPTGKTCPSLTYEPREGSEGAQFSLLTPSHPHPFLRQTCCSHVLNINYNCYSLQSRKAPGTNTMVHFLALAQGIVGSRTRGGRASRVPRRAEGKRWRVHRPRWAGMVGRSGLSEKPSHTGQPVYSACAGGCMSHRLKGKSKPGAASDAPSVRVLDRHGWAGAQVSRCQVQWPSYLCH